jgi:hypothetical protein
MRAFKYALRWYDQYHDRPGEWQYYDYRKHRWHVLTRQPLTSESARTFVAQFYGCNVADVTMVEVVYGERMES